MKTIYSIILGAALICSCTGCTSPSSSNKERTPMANEQQKQLTAKRYYSGFPYAHDTYNAISCGSDGKIYYVLSSQPHDVAGQMHVYDPQTDKTSFIADLNSACSEKESKTIAQGKSHVEFVEKEGKLYFATHIGYYQMIDGAEMLPTKAPDGYGLYPGGHFMAYDMKSGLFEKLATAPDGEGILTFTMDTANNQLYGITWPKGYFIHYDMNTGTLKNMGPTEGLGEAGVPGKDYRVICRSMFVEPSTHKVYYSTAEGFIYAYAPGDKAPKKLENVDLKIDYFGSYDVTKPGSMVYNWRKIFWYEPEQVAYGVHGNSGYLFKFDPKNETVEVIDRIVSEPSRRCGMFDQFSYGYLGYILGPDSTIYYLTGAPVYQEGKRVKGLSEINMGAAKGIENLHLVTYNIPQKKYTDHGPILYEDGAIPTYVNSIALDKSGNVYTLARFIQEGKEIEDLIRIDLK